MKHKNQSVKEPMRNYLNDWQFFVKHNSHIIEYRGCQSHKIASIYIDGRFEYDTLKNSDDAIAAAIALCDSIDAHNPIRKH